MLTLQCRRKEFDFAKSFSPYYFLCVKKAWGKKKRYCLLATLFSKTLAIALWDRYYQFHNQNTRNSKRHVSCIITTKWHPVPISPKSLNVGGRGWKSSRFSMSMHTFDFPHTAEFEIKAFWSCWAFIFVLRPLFALKVGILGIWSFQPIFRRNSYTYLCLLCNSQNGVEAVPCHSRNKFSFCSRRFLVSFLYVSQTV